MDFGTRDEQQALAELRALLEGLEKRLGLGRNRAMARIPDLKPRAYQYVMNGSIDGTRGLPTQGAVQKILDGLGATQKEQHRAGKLLLLIQQWRERGAMADLMLPPEPDIFAGRDEDMDRLLSRLDPSKDADAAAVTLMGMGGVGKTALAGMAAREAFARGWFLGGVFYVDLRGFSVTEERALDEVLELFVTTLTNGRKAPATVERKLATWNRLLTRRDNDDKHLLLILDNVRVSQQVKDLLPPHPHRALITTRNALSDLKAEQLTVDTLDRAGSLAVLKEAVTVYGDRAMANRIAQEEQAAGEISQLCGNLPLALRIVGALIREEPGRPLQAVADELADRHHRLKHLRYEPMEVRASFELSYAHLSDEQRRAFHLLAAVPGAVFSTESSRPLLNAPSRRLLADLSRAHLLQQTGNEHWQFHDLVRLYADDPDNPDPWADERPAAFERLFEHMAVRSTFAEQRRSPLLAHKLQDAVEGADPGLDFENADEATAWLEREADSIVSCAISPAAAGSTLRATAPFVLPHFLQSRSQLPEWLALTSALVGEADSPDDVPWSVQLAHAQALLKNGQVEESMVLLSGLVPAFESKEVTREGRSATFSALSSAYLVGGNLNLALQCAHLAAEWADTRVDGAIALLRSADAVLEVGAWQAAMVALQDAEEIFTADGLHGHVADARRVRGLAMLGAALGEGAKLEPGLTLLRDVLASGHLKPADVPSVHLTMARALHGADRCREAQTEFGRAAEAFLKVDQVRNSEASLVSRGLCRVQSGSRDTGMKLCRQVIRRARKHRDEELASLAEAAMKRTLLHPDKKGIACFELPEW
ncbi:NB-ARC domain-containing protein [Streptomyces sp. NPDC001948]